MRCNRLLWCIFTLILIQICIHFHFARSHAPPHTATVTLMHADSDSQSHSISLSILDCLSFFRHRQFLNRYKNSWKQCNQPQSSRCNSIFFDFIFVTVIVIVDAILMFNGIVRKLCGCSTIHALHCFRFGNLLCLLSVLFDFFFYFSIFFRVVSFVYCLLPYCTHTHKSTRVLKLFFEFASQIHAIAFD